MARLSLVAGAIAVVVAIALLGIGSGLFVDALWFRHLGVLVVFRTALVAKLACFTLAFAACYVVVAAVGLAAVRHDTHLGRGAGRVPAHRRRSSYAPRAASRPVADRLPWRAMVLAAAAVIAVLVAVAQMASWQTYLLWLYGGEFGVKDPFFGRDVGFFVFALPAYQTLIGGAMAIVVLAALLAAVVFWLHGALDFRRPGDVMPPAARSLLSLLLALFLLVKGGRVLDRPLRAAARTVRGGVRRRLHGRPREAAVPMDARGRGPRGRRARGGEPARAGLAAAGRGRGRGVRCGDRLVDSARRLSAPAGAPRRAPPGAAVPREEHRHDPPCVRPRRHSAAAVPGGADARRGGRRTQPGDLRERPAVGPAAAPRHLPPAAADPPLLRLPRRRRRPLRASRVAGAR